MEPAKNYQLEASEQSINHFRLKKKGIYTIEKHYIFELKNLTNNQLLVSGSDQQIKIYNKELLKLEASLKYHTKPINQISTLSNHPALFLSCSDDNTIAFWDVRTAHQPIRIWSDGNNNINSIDVNNDQSIVVAGTKFNTNFHEAKLLFWDFRSDKLIQEMVECHNDDITQVKFNSLENNRLISGSMDGLICHYKLISNEEDENLETTNNFNHSLMALNYFGNNNEFIYALSHMETFAIFNANADLIHDFGSLKNASCYKIDFKVDYVINAYFHQPLNQLFVYGGSYDGKIGLFSVQPNGQLLLKYVLSNGHNDVVRDVIWDHQNHVIFSGGEDGNLITWNYQESQVSNGFNTNNQNNSANHIRFKPY